ncbi:hypothetical protein [Amycolatopsis regifaucium]|uniref:hypothetical protein n=1 Tax=Amycolatopsis regifaucium TaxID=546365 RepID=UPI0008F62127|nr:hypothetical protein [Amycolatopsis regifaucium]SFJ15835.1 hypothetical protein SAMN04489731_11673 [Amycolatopsis regifaucium]
MLKKLLTATAFIVLSTTVTAPAQAVPAYYQQTVTGSTLAECNAAGSQLAQQKRAQGYLVTWTGCGHQGFGYVGLVSWSD